MADVFDSVEVASFVVGVEVIVGVVLVIVGAKIVVIFVVLSAAVGAKK